MSPPKGSNSIAPQSRYEGDADNINIVKCLLLIIHLISELIEINLTASVG